MTSSMIEDDRRIPAGRFTAGVMIHLMPLGYVVALTMRILHEGRVRTDATGIGGYLVLAMWTTAAWLVLTLAASLAASAGSAVLRRRRLRAFAHSPDRETIESRDRLVRAWRLLEANRRHLDNEATSWLDSIRTVRWRHDEDDFRRLSTDLLRIATTLDQAIDSRAVSPHVSHAVAVVCRAVASAADDHGRDEGERARILADYISSRHGQDPDVRRIP